MILARVITCSDRSWRGEREDRSGPAVRELLEKAGVQVDRVQIVPDELARIAGAIKAAVADGMVLIVTSGGTGIAPRDVTPEATLTVSDRVIPGFGELMRRVSEKSTPMAALSRAQATTRGAALIVNLPGSVSGAVENLQAILHLIPHTLQLLAGGHVDVHPGKEES